MGKWDQYIVADAPTNKWDQYAVSAPQDEVKPKKVEGIGNQIVDAAVKTPGILANSFGKTAGTVIKSVDQAVRHPIKTAGAVNDAVQEGFYHPIRSSKKIIKSIGDKVQNNDPFGAILDASAVTGGAGLGLKATRIPSAVKAGDAMIDASLTPIKAANNAGKTIIKSAKDLKNGSGKVISSVRDYPANKVNSIRREFWDKTAPEEYQAFGDAIEEIPKQGGGMVDGASALQNIEKQMFEKGLMAEDGKLLLPRTTADAKFVKAYQATYKKWANSPDGKLDINDVINEYKNIKGAHAKKPTKAQRDNTQAANDFFNSVADQIDQKSFGDAKKRYRKFKEDQQLIDEAVGLYDPEMKTGKGERWLTEGPIQDTAQGRKTAQMITSRTGQTLQGAKLWSKRKYINPLNLIPSSK